MTAPPICLDDGYTREAFSYQDVNAYVTAKWYVLCRTHGIAVPADFERRLQAMFDFAARIIRPDGSHPVQGESYPDNSHEHFIAAHEMLHLGAALFDRRDWRAVAGGLNDDRLSPDWLWIVEPEAYGRWKTMPPAALRARTIPSSLRTQQALHPAKRPRPRRPLRADLGHEPPQPWPLRRLAPGGPWPGTDPHQRRRLRLVRRRSPPARLAAAAPQQYPPARHDPGRQAVLQRRLHPPDPLARG